MSNSNTIQSKQTELARNIGKLLRDNFGKGPDSLFVTCTESVITVYLKNFLSPTEKILIEQNHHDMFIKTRDAIMVTLIPKIKAYMSVITGMDIDEFYYDWGLHNGSGIFVGLSSGFKDIQLENMESSNYEGKKQVEEEISSISKKVQKLPVDVFSFQVNPRTTLVIREDILVPIEKELIRMGYEEILRITKLKLEKTYLHNNPIFERVLKCEVVDIFVDWDFGKNKSVIVFISQPLQPQGK
ncbi:MAG TPA: Na-translocating system protein MpsC family protein [Candidatus Angelobacter sp.]|nr:Na-translocating system protein MpsC family protein [Candidatus Angelobacter sp.]